MKKLWWRLVLLLFVILIISFPAKSVPLHENFDLTDEDLYAIFEFFSDAKVLCEESLEYSFLANCSIDFNGNVLFGYSQENLDLSGEKSNELNDKLSYSSDIVENLKDKAGSYQYLKDLLYPIKDLGGNVSFFVSDHYKVITNFTKIVGFIKSNGNNKDSSSSLANTSLCVSKCRGDIASIELNLAEINNSFPKDIIISIISSLNQMLDRYEYYLNSLVNLLVIDEPTLLLYVDENQVYLGEKIDAFGYFIADKTFVSNQTINLYWDETVINNTFSDGFGRYDFVISISLNENPGFYNLSASTIYNNTVVISNIVLVNVKKIPTNIIFSSSKTDYYLNESIFFFGRITDYKNRGISVNLFLDFAGFNISFKSDENGIFTYVFNSTLSFGKYSATVFFASDQFYENCKSKRANINISTPTLLTLNLTTTSTVKIGEEIKLHGRLTSQIDNSSLASKTVEIFLNDKKTGVAKTDSLGFYNYTITTDDLDAGAYNVYSKFSSDEVEWRGSSSKVIQLQMESVATQSSIFYLGIVFVVIFIAGIIFILRKRLFNIFRRKSSRVFAIGDIKNISSGLFEKIDMNVKDFTIDTLTIKSGDSDLRGAIISKYQNLLRLLSSRGIMIEPGNTHLDIHKSMLKQGFSQNATNFVTKTFEYALYSPYHIDRKDVILFNVNIEIILKTTRGDIKYGD